MFWTVCRIPKLHGTYCTFAVLRAYIVCSQMPLSHSSIVLMCVLLYLIHSSICVYSLLCRYFVLRIIDVMLTKLIPELDNKDFQKQLAQLRTLNPPPRNRFSVVRPTWVVAKLFGFLFVYTHRAHILFMSICIYKGYYVSLFLKPFRYYVVWFLLIIVYIASFICPWRCG